MIPRDAWAALADGLHESTGYGVTVYLASTPRGQAVNIYFADDPGVTVTYEPVAPEFRVLGVGFAGIDLWEKDTLSWRSFSAPFFASAMLVWVPWARSVGYTKWEATPDVSDAMRGVLTGMGWTPDLHLDLSTSTIVDEWLADHGDPYHDLFRSTMKEILMAKYLTLTEEDRLVLARDRLRSIESDHFRLTLEGSAVLTGTPASEANSQRVAELEAAMGKLQAEVESLTPKT